jgi:hypothetical protein
MIAVEEALRRSERMAEGDGGAGLAQYARPRQKGN